MFVGREEEGLFYTPILNRSDKCTDLMMTDFHDSSPPHSHEYCCSGGYSACALVLRSQILAGESLAT